MQKQNNIFGYQGLIKDEDTWQKLFKECTSLSFTTSFDLTKPVIIESNYGCEDVSLLEYTRNIAEFSVWWGANVYVDLNRFSGFSTIKFVPKGFKVIV